MVCVMHSIDECQRQEPLCGYHLHSETPPHEGGGAYHAALQRRTTVQTLDHQPHMMTCLCIMCLQWDACAVHALSGQLFDRCVNGCSGVGSCIGGFCRCPRGRWGIDCSRTQVRSHLKTYAAQQQCSPAPASRLLRQRLLRAGDLHGRLLPLPARPLEHRLLSTLPVK